MTDNPAWRPRFFADAMLGSLARWLRTLGYDCLYENAIDDREIIRRAADEGRVILTRDTLLAERKAAKGICFLIKGNGVAEQIREVDGRFKLDAGFFLTRCLRCNAALEGVERGAVKGLVAGYVFDTQESFSRCPSCARVYWGGTHRVMMLEALKRMTGRSFGDTQGLLPPQ